MKKKIDDLLNKYIDNELDSAELAELNNLLDEDESSVKELKAYKVVEQSLRKMEFENSPSNTTYLVMQKIASMKKVKKSNWFFWFCLSFFLVGIAVATFYTIKNYQPSESSIVSDKTVTAVQNFIGDQKKSIDTLLLGIDIKLIGTIMTLLFVITGYFLIETHRNFRNKLKSL